MRVEADSVPDTSEVEEALKLYNELSDSKKKQFIILLLNLEENEGS